MSTRSSRSPKNTRRTVSRIEPPYHATRTLRLCGGSGWLEAAGAAIAVESGVSANEEGAVAPASGSGDGRGFNDGVAGAISNMLVVTLAATAAPEADTILGAG